MSRSNNPNVVVAASRNSASQLPVHFPHNLESITNNRFTIRFHEYTRGNPLDAPKNSPVFSISLPLPQSGLEDNLSIDYDETALGAAVGGALGTFGSAGQGTTWAQKAAAFGEGGIQHAMTSAAGRFGDLIGQVTFTPGLGDKLKSSAPQAIGNALNPNLSLTFNGVHLREHSFSWRFIAKSEEESRTLQKIEKMLKQAALPRKVEGVAVGLAYPHIAFLEFVPKDLIKVSELGCFLTDISFKYDGDGHPAFYKVTNQPVVVDVALRFHERAIHTAETYGAESISVGDEIKAAIKGL